MKSFKVDFQKYAEIDRVLHFGVKFWRGKNCLVVREHGQQLKVYTHSWSG